MTTFTTEDRINANTISKTGKSNEAYINELETMLRQQADRITELEKQISPSVNNAQNLSKIDETLPNGKPVAYRWKSDLGYIYDVFNHGDGEPLYTHPVKQLTPERISDIADETYAHYGLTPPSDLKLMVMGHFARAIIKEITE